MEQVRNARAHAADVAKALADARARLDALRASATGELKQTSHDRLPAFEEALKAGNIRLATMKAELATLIKDREDEIRRAVESAPDHVNRQAGFLAQIVALEHMAQEDRKIALVILLIDFVSFGFELAAVLAKVTSYVPTTYSMLLARDAYLTSVRIADEVAAASNTGGGPQIPPQDVPLAPEQAPPTPSPIPVSPSAAAPLPGDAAQPPKRKRGRPRKHPLPPVIRGANGRDSSGDPGEEPEQE
jgi:hypothetical protein